MCPEIQGAIVLVRNLGWAHIVCVNWVQTIYFVPGGDGRSIEGVLPGEI